MILVLSAPVWEHTRTTLEPLGGVHNLKYSLLAGVEHVRSSVVFALNPCILIESTASRFRYRCLASPGDARVMWKMESAQLHTRQFRGYVSEITAVVFIFEDALGLGLMGI